MADLKNHVGGMMDQVRALSQSLGALHGELGRGRDEVRRLSDELAAGCATRCSPTRSPAC
jgi:hypothetical protein